MNIHEGRETREVPRSTPCGVLFMERQIFVSEQNLNNEFSTSSIAPVNSPCLSNTTPAVALGTIDGTTHTSPREQSEERNFDRSQKLEEICDNGDFLDDIDHHLHYQLDVEIEQFRSNLHSILSQRTEGSRQMSPLQTVPQFFGSQDNNSSDCVRSSSSITDLMKMEESMTSASSVHDFEEDGPNFGVNYKESRLEVDQKLNQLLIQLQTSLSILSNNLCREEYIT